MQRPEKSSTPVPVKNHKHHHVPVSVEKHYADKTSDIVTKSSTSYSISSSSSIASMDKPGDTAKVKAAEVILSKNNRDDFKVKYDTFRSSVLEKEENQSSRKSSSHDTKMNNSNNNAQLKIADLHLAQRVCYIIITRNIITVHYITRHIIIIIVASTLYQ